MYAILVYWTRKYLLYIYNVFFEIYVYVYLYMYIYIPTYFGCFPLGIPLMPPGNHLHVILYTSSHHDTTLYRSTRNTNSDLTRQATKPCLRMFQVYLRYVKGWTWTPSSTTFSLKASNITIWRTVFLGNFAVCPLFSGTTINWIASKKGSTCVFEDLYRWYLLESI